MHAELLDRVVLVTGGGSGIGRACGQALAAAGATVMLCGRTTSKLERAAAGIAEATGRTPAIHTTDVSQKAEVESLVRETIERFGRLDILVNNAGVSARGRVAELSDEVFDRALEINLRGAFLCARAAWPHLAASQDGYIFNIASYAGKHGMAGSGAYCASKFGLVGLSESMSEEGRDAGVRVTAICPGFVATPMVAGAPVAAEAMLQPEDIAKTILWLLSMSRVSMVKEVVLSRTGA